MKVATFRQCKGNGQGSCIRCAKRGKWNQTWMEFLYKIDGRDGIYCRNCIDEIASEEYDVLIFKDDD